MKRRLLMASMAMVAALASCSKDVTTTPDDVNNATKETAYAKVSLSFGSATRADNETFDEGDAETERKIKTVTLVVYDQAGDAVGFGTLAVNEKNGTEDGVSDIYKAQVVELEMINTSSDPTQVVAYINTTVNVELPLSEAMKQTMERSKITNADKTFVMTNAGYYDGSNWTVATKIEGVYGTPEAAEKGNTTTIYVERLAAKVSVKLNGEIETIAEGIKIYGVDGTEYQLEFDAENASWAPTGIAQTMYTLKNAWEDYNLGTDWTNGTKRSFWAAGAYYGTAYADMKANLDYASYNDVIGEGEAESNMGGSFYVTEHTYGKTTMGDSKYSPVGAATSAIVIGQYKVVKESDADDDELVETTDFDNEDGEPDFYLLLKEKETADKVYTIYTEEQLIAYLFESEKVKLYADNNGSTEITKDTAKDYLKLKWNSETKKYSLELKEATTKVYAKNAVEEGEEQEATYSEYDEFKFASNARHYNLGYAYFFSPIKHNIPEETAPESEGTYGVVRNHIYNLTITSITGLGAPLDDDHFGEDGQGETPIEPDPDEEAYIKVELKVLSWHVINQEVEL